MRKAKKPIHELHRFGSYAISVGQRTIIGLKFGAKRRRKLARRLYHTREVDIASLEMPGSFSDLLKPETALGSMLQGAISGLSFHMLNQEFAKHGIERKPLNLTEQELKKLDETRERLKKLSKRNRGGK